MYSLQYRSKTFDDIYGHKTNVKEFKKRSENINFPDVMIMSGLSGSGKTTSAFMIAKLLNCKTPIKQADGHNEPCNECASCKDINEEKFSRDVFFKNASEMGKEDVNKLNDLVNNFPMFDKNIIIILDEAQELSKSGKGATLKLLEKTRKNVYFILCTMDSNAFDIAVKRRGQTYLFKEVSSDDIAEYLAFIVKKEGLFDTLPDEFIFKGLFFIANNSYGSPGYAVSILERCIAGEIYSEEDITRELGLVSDSVSTNILEKMLRTDKSVFEDLKSTELKELYFKSAKILREAYIYGVHGYISDDWKLPSAKTLSKNTSQLEKLIEMFYAVKSEPYFNENSFYVELIKYYKENENKEVPVIRKRAVQNG